MQPLPQPVISMRQGASADGAKAWRTLKQAKARFERRYLIAALTRAHGCVSTAAKLAGRDRPYFYRLLKMYQLDPRDYLPHHYRRSTRRSCTRNVVSLPPTPPAAPRREWFGVSLDQSPKQLH